MKHRSAVGSSVLTIRVPKALDRKLAQKARSLRQSRSATARALLESALAGMPKDDPAAEARRQSLLAGRRGSEQEALTFVTDAADLRGWT